MAKPGQLIFHLIATSILAYGIYYDVTVVKLPEGWNIVTFAGRWKYLTFWNVNIQLVYFAFGVINDLFGTSSLAKKDAGFLQSIRDYLFGSWLHPLALFVSISFWGIWAVDRELIFPKALDPFFPSWLNHVLHTSIIIFSTIEMATVPKTFPVRSKALMGVATIITSYALWVFYIAYRTNHWVYPVLAVLHWGFRILFIVGLVFFTILLYFVGEKLHFALWGRPQDEAGKKSKNVKSTKEISTNRSTTKKKGKQV